MLQVVSSEDNLANSEAMPLENLRASKNTQWLNLEYVDIETIYVEGGSKRIGLWVMRIASLVELLNNGRIKKRLSKRVIYRRKGPTQMML